MHLGQNNPKDQLMVAIGAVEMNLLNLEENISAPERTAENIRLVLESMKMVLPHLEGVGWKKMETPEIPHGQLQWAKWAVREIPKLIESHWAHRHSCGCQGTIRRFAQDLRNARALLPKE